MKTNYINEMLTVLPSSLTKPAVYNILAFTFGCDVDDVNENIDKYRKLSPMKQQLLFHQYDVNLSFAEQSISVYSDLSSQIFSAMAGFENPEKFLTSVEAPFSFPFTQKANILKNMENYYGHVPISQIMSGYLYKGISLLLGDDLYAMERLLFSELDNFPLDDLTVLILKDKTEEFVSFDDLSISVNRLSELNDNQLKKESLNIVNIDDNLSSIIEGKDSLSSIILTDAAFLSIEKKGLSELLLGSGVNLVIMSQSPSPDLYDMADYRFIFETTNVAIHQSAGIDESIYQSFFDVKEKGQIRFFLVNAENENFVQIYPWINSKAHQGSTFKTGLSQLA